jgi:hypothetical protein
LLGDTLKLQQAYRIHYGFACKEVHLDGRYGVDCASRQSPEADHDLYFGTLQPDGIFLLQAGKTVENGSVHEMTGDRLAAFASSNTNIFKPLPTAGR